MARRRLPPLIAHGCITQAPSGPFLLSTYACCWWCCTGTRLAILAPCWPAVLAPALYHCLPAGAYWHRIADIVALLYWHRTCTTGSAAVYARLPARTRAHARSKDHARNWQSMKHARNCPSRNHARIGRNGVCKKGFCVMPNVSGTHFAGIYDAYGKSSQDQRSLARLCSLMGEGKKPR